MPGPANTEGAKIAVSNESPATKSTRWGFLNKLKGKLNSILMGSESNPELQIQKPVEKKFLPKKLIYGTKIPEGSGLAMLISDLETERNIRNVRRIPGGNTERITVQAIEVLLGDFYAYIDTLNPEIKESVRSELNNGNLDLIDALARIKLADYNKQIHKRIDTHQHLSKEEKMANPMHEGFKKVMAQNLSQAMEQRIGRKYHRQSAGQLLDLKSIVSGRATKLTSRIPVPGDSGLKQAEQILIEAQKKY